MLNLLGGEAYKLRKGKSLFVGILVAVAIVLLLYGSLYMIDKINQGELANGTGGITVYESGGSVQEDGKSDSMMEQIGIEGVLQQMFGGHFVGLILAVLVNMFVIREYHAGAIKNLVGKGYSRRIVFFSKLLSSIVLSVIFQIVVSAVSILIGIPFLGSKGLSLTIWKDVATYAGLQLMFGITITGFFVMIGEFTRNLAAGIAVSIGILLFSTTLTEVLDLMCHKIDFKPSDYWILNLIPKCPLTEFETEFLVRGVLVSVVWFFLAVMLGAVHFTKADIK